MGLDFFHEKIVRNGQSERFQPKEERKTLVKRNSKQKN